jgi:hypothetical protein
VDELNEGLKRVDQILETASPTSPKSPTKFAETHQGRKILKLTEGQKHLKIETKPKSLRFGESVQKFGLE